MKTDFSAHKVILSKVVIPELKATRSNNQPYWQPNLKDDYYLNLIKLYDESSLHKAILTNLRDKIVGTNIEASRALKSMIKSITLDMIMLGGFCVEIIWNAEHTKINKLLYLDFSKVRSGLVDEDTDEVLLYYYSYNWKNRGDDITILHRYDPDPATDNHQIYYYKDEGRDIYPKPYYHSALRWIYTDVEMARYYSNLVKNNFMPSIMISLKNGFEDEDKRGQFERDMLNTLTGPDNSAAIPIIYGDGTGEDPLKIIQLSEGPDDQKYTWLSQHTIDQLIMAHRIPNPLLAGVRVPGTLGGTQELKEAEFIYNKNVVYPFRENITQFLEDVVDFYINPIGIEIKDISVLGEQTLPEQINQPIV
jgi:hypothetical protein